MRFIISPKIFQKKFIALAALFIILGISAFIQSACDNDSQSEPLCNGKTGLTRPLAVCSAVNPCKDAIVFENGGAVTKTVTTPSDAPECSTTVSHHPFFDDGAPISWVDADGVTRYTCLFDPGASSIAKRPLVLFFHGTGGHANDAHNLTLLRAKAVNYDLTGDPSRPGFILASVQGRNLHWPTIHNPGRHHDYYYRDMGAPSTNQDVAHVDHLIDLLVNQQQIVDPTRIYVMGWSNGATFAQFYAIARHVTPTPGGNQIAAAAVYAFADPFADIASGQTPSCEMNPYPASTVPLHLVNRACDSLTACDAAQQTAFSLPPGHSAADWVAQLQTVVGDPNVTFQIIDFRGQSALACTLAPACDQDGGTLNHLRWPDGILDDIVDDGILNGSATDQEPQMLDFLKNNPHN